MQLFGVMFSTFCGPTFKSNLADQIATLLCNKAFSLEACPSENLGHRKMLTLVFFTTTFLKKTNQSEKAKYDL